MDKIKQSILAIVIGLVLSAGVSYAYSTWTGPTANPTDKNVDAPVNVGPTTQSKAGSLNLNGTIQVWKVRATSGAGATGMVLTSDDTDGTAKWKTMKSTIVESVKTKSCNSYPCTNTWGSYPAAYCDTGYVRTGCTTSCSGSFSESSPDLSPTVTGEGCNLGANDRCVTSSAGSMESPTRIKVKAICVKFE